MVDEPTEICFLGDSGDSLTLHVLGYTHPESDDYWDGNWVRARVKAVAAFSGEISGNLFLVDLQSFLSELQRLYAELAGTATFSAMEGWLDIEIQVDKLGQISITGFASDPHRLETVLRFTIHADQSYLPASIEQLAATFARFPVKG